MKSFILVLIAAILFDFVNAVEFDEEDVYDDDDVYEKSAIGKEAAEEAVRPQYNINDAPQLFAEFIKTYNKQYKSEKEHNERYANFVTNLEEIIANNKEGRGSVSDINMFADYSDDELAKRG